MSRSDSEIKRWKDIREKYVSGKFKGHLPIQKRLFEFKTRLNTYKASLTLGREFNESIDSYLERKELTKFFDWNPDTPEFIQV